VYKAISHLWGSIALLWGPISLLWGPNLPLRHVLCYFELIFQIA